MNKYGFSVYEVRECDNCHETRRYRYIRTLNRYICMECLNKLDNEIKKIKNDE